MEEAGEGAAVGHGLNGVMNALRVPNEFGRGVGLPLRMDLKIVVHALMAEVHVLVTPVGGLHRGQSFHLTNHLLNSTELSGLIHGINVEEHRARRDRLQIVHERRVVGLFRELPIARGLKAEREGEIRFFVDTFLSVRSHVRQANSLDILRGSLKPELERDKSRGVSLGDMIGPVISEEIKIVLSIDAEHSDEIGRVDTITEELDTHAWLHVGSFIVDGSSS